MEDRLEERINYHFENKDLLQRALLHRSRANEERQKQDQDALRTLGDAVLKTILCDLFMRSGYETKGEITIMKSAIENRPFLAELGRGFGLQNEILVGTGAEKQKHNEGPNVIAETLEAIIGAMYLDGGYESAQKAVSGWYEPYREKMLKGQISEERDRQVDEKGSSRSAGNGCWRDTASPVRRPEPEHFMQIVRCHHPRAPGRPLPSLHRVFSLPPVFGVRRPTLHGSGSRPPAREPSSAARPARRP